MVPIKNLLPTYRQFISCDVCTVLFIRGASTTVQPATARHSLRHLQRKHAYGTWRPFVCKSKLFMGSLVTMNIVWSAHAISRSRTVSMLWGRLSTCSCRPMLVDNWWRRRPCAKILINVFAYAPCETSQRGSINLRSCRTSDDNNVARSTFTSWRQRGPCGSDRERWSVCNHQRG